MNVNAADPGDVCVPFVFVEKHAQLSSSSQGRCGRTTCPKVAGSSPWWKKVCWEISNLEQAVSSLLTVFPSETYAYASHTCASNANAALLLAS